MDIQGNPCALKGGTALRFAIDLPRPSTDLDFEGDNRIELRKSLKRALQRAFPQERYRIGRDWGLRGMVAIRTRPQERAEATRVMIDYRLTGTFIGMPAETPLDETVMRGGMRIYETRELVRRKLQTITGASPRVLPRDVYDAGWLATTHPELIRHDDRKKLKQWLKETIENGLVETRKNDLTNDVVTGRISADRIWNAVNRGISRLETTRAHDQSRDEHMDTGGSSMTKPPIKPSDGSTANPPKAPSSARDYLASLEQKPKGPSYTR